MSYERKVENLIALGMEWKLAQHVGDPIVETWVPAVSAAAPLTVGSTTVVVADYQEGAITVDGYLDCSVTTGGSAGTTLVVNAPTNIHQNMDGLPVAFGRVYAGASIDVYAYKQFPGASANIVLVCMDGGTFAAGVSTSIQLNLRYRKA